MIRPIDHEPPSSNGQSREFAEAIFRPGGYLEQVLGLEFRPEQSQMAMALSGSFSADTPLLFEAGTGVGKSLAYLIPGLLHAQLAERRMLVSTHTISLQQQILGKDLPLCRKLFSNCPALRHLADFREALLLGRRNYLCPPRLARAIETRTDLFGSDEQDELERIFHWSNVTKTGIRDELNPQPREDVWEWVHADSSLSNSRNPSCFYQRARKQLREAHLIVVNHALLFSLIQAGAVPETDQRGVLFPDDFLVIDEAHRVPAIATDHFGLGLSSFGLERCLKSLYHPERKRGLLKKHGNEQDRKLVLEILTKAELFFSELHSTQLEKREQQRLHEPNWTEPILEGPLEALAQRIGSLAQRSNDEQQKDELLDQRRRVLAYRDGLREARCLAEEGQVYWLERASSKRPTVRLCSAPIDVAPKLNETLFTRDTSVVLTSATLATGKSMEAFSERCGAWGQATEQVDSPFDYESQMRVYIFRDMPEPEPSTRQLSWKRLGEMIAKTSLAVPGGTLALFTSHRDIRETLPHIRMQYAKAGREVFAQGGGQSRNKLVEQFRQAGDAILLGTDSFWTGVDVPGPALSHLLIARLPFEHPGHPILEARGEWHQARGENPFLAMSLPEALVKFRQGVGRLIRTSSDRGTVTILDSRLFSKAYGNNFIQCLPSQNVIPLRCSQLERFKPL